MDLSGQELHSTVHRDELSYLQQWTHSSRVVILESGVLRALPKTNKTVWLFRFSTAYLQLPCSSDSKEFACNAGDPGSIPGQGRSSGEGNGNPLHYSFLENPMDRGPWRAIVSGVTKSWTQLSDQHYYYSMLTISPEEKRRYHPVSLVFRLWLF